MSASCPFRCIDARDHARLAVDLMSSRTVDTVHVTATSPEHTFADLLGESADGVGQVRPDCTRARAYGLTPRPMADSARDLLARINDGQDQR